MSLGFSAEERLRYSRNVILPEVGWPGQERLRAASAAVVGAGGIGSAALFYLAAAGVGHLGSIDGDRVELANLQRQILHRVADLGRLKVESGQEALTALNPHCRVQTYATRLTGDNIQEILTGYALVLDASDNFETRRLVADWCWQAQVPLVSAAASGFQGLLLVVDPSRGSPCYRCLVPDLPPPAPPEGIMGAVAGVMGCLQALEAVKILLGRGSDLAQAVLSYDGLRCRFRTLKRLQAPGCPRCGASPRVTGGSPPGPEDTGKEESASYGK